MNDDASPSVKIDVGAKLEVKTEVPAEASGRLVHAFADIVSPLSEWLGYIGDKLRIHRSLAMIQVIRRAEERLASDSRDHEPIPIKIVVPLLEFASREELDDNLMIDMWANLLVSATVPNMVAPRFVSLLGELNGTQARILMAMRSEGTHARSLGGLGKRLIKDRFTRGFELRPTPMEALEAAQPVISANLDGVARLIVLEIYVSQMENGELKEVAGRGGTGLGIPEEIGDAQTADFEILNSLGLLEFEELRITLDENHEVYCKYCALSALGVSLLELVKTPVASPALPANE